MTSSLEFDIIIIIAITIITNSSSRSSSTIIIIITVLTECTTPDYLNNTPIYVYMYNLPGGSNGHTRQWYIKK